MARVFTLLGTALALAMVGCSPVTPDTSRNAANSGALKPPKKPITTPGSGNPSAQRPADPDMESMVGSQVPPFSLTLVDGTQVSSDALKGKVVLLDFWATWCKYCVAATPKFEEWKQDFAGKPFEVYALNTTEIFDESATKEQKTEASRKACIAYRDEHKYTLNFAIYGDELYDAWKIKGLPALILIDQQGQVVEVANKADAKTLAGFQMKILALLR